MTDTRLHLQVMSRLPHYCPVCAYQEWNLDGLVDMVWDYLDLQRIYTKPKVIFFCMFVGGTRQGGAGRTDWSAS